MEAGRTIKASTNLATVTTHDLPTVAGVWHGTDGSPEMRADLFAAVPEGADATTAAAALHAQIGTSACLLALACVDDLAGCTERPNRPGTIGGGNWSVRLPGATDHVVTATPGREIIDALATTRR